MKVKYNADFSAKMEYKDGAEFDANYGQGGGGGVPKYTGEYEVTPSFEEQTLETKGLKMTDDVTVHAIELNLENKSVSFTPSEEAQSSDVEKDEGYDALGKVSVSVGAIPDDYVGSAVERRDSSDLSASGDTISAPSGYYGNSASLAVSHGSATVSTSITANPAITLGTDGSISASVSKTASVTPTVAEGYVTEGTQGTVTVSGSNSKQLPTQGATTITPTESEQTAVAQGKFTTGEVKVGAISSTYVGSEVDRRDSTDLSASGATVSVPSGYYAENASKSVQSGSATTPSTSITANPSISVNTSTGVITASVSASQSVTPSVSEGYVTSGTSGTVSVSGSNTSSLSTQSGTTITPTTSEQTAVDANKYTLGAVKVAAMPNGVRGNRTNRQNWSSTKSIYTIEYPDATSGYYPSSTVSSPGSIELTRQTETVTPSTSTQEVTPTNAYHFLEKVTVNAMPSGTAGTPTATKGTVNNHSISVTPSVTNSTGYITGSTINGTAVSVSASELVSGSQTITQNSTVDVTNLAEVVVSVSGGSPNLQAKTNIDPTTSSQTIQADTGYDGLSSVQINAMPSGAVALPTALASSGGATVTSSGTEITLTKQMTIQASVTTAGYVSSIPSSTADVTLRATDANFLDSNIKSGVSLFGKTGTYSGGTSKNTQVVQGTTRTTSSTLTAIGAELTVSKTGTYDIYWSGVRTNTSTSYTYGTRLYIGGTAYGTENTTWSNHVQNNHLTSVSLTVNQKIRVYGRCSRGSTYYIYAPTLVIVEN